jgi:hypothetical protein
MKVEVLVDVMATQWVSTSDYSKGCWKVVNWVVWWVRKMVGQWVTLKEKRLDRMKVVKMV